jgi:hypothetical protein
MNPHLASIGSRESGGARGEVIEESAASVHRQWSNHLAFYGRDRLTRCAPTLLSTGGEHRREFSTPFCFERSRDEASLLETAKYAVHCLPADKRPSS